MCDCVCGLVVNGDVCVGGGCGAFGFCPLATALLLQPKPIPPLFTRRSRGISSEVARQLLVYSFGREVVQTLRDEVLQARVESAVAAKLSAFATAP